MAFTLVGYSQSQDTAAALTSMTPVPDTHVRVSGQDIIVPALNLLIGAWAGGATISQAQIQSPTLRRQQNIDIGPLNISAAVVQPGTLNDFSQSPVDLSKDEALDFFVAETAAGAERENGLIWLSDGNLSPVAGDVFTLRFTGTTTLVAFTWTACPITFAQTLPAGLYAVVGMHMFGATPLAARINPVGSLWRPGCLAFATNSAFYAPQFRRNSWGEWCRFAHNTPPQIEVFATAADTAQTGFLDLVKVG